VALPSGLDGSVQSPRRRLELGASMEASLVLEALHRAPCHRPQHHSCQNLKTTLSGFSSPSELLSANDARMCPAIRHRPGVLTLQSDLSLIRVFCRVNPFQRSRSDHFCTAARKGVKCPKASLVSPTFYKPLFLFPLSLPPPPP
jgi:hypothetical protein